MTMSIPLTTIESKERESAFEISDESDDWCPLFSTDLPKNFSSNVAIGAIASLLDDSEEAISDGNDGDTDMNSLSNEQQNHTVAHRQPTQVITGSSSNIGKGKGRVVAKKDRKAKINRFRPYDNPIQRKEQTRDRDRGSRCDECKEANASSVGEAQIFLQLWKI